MAATLMQSCTVRPSAFYEKLPEQHLGGFEMDLLTRLTKEPLPFATLLGIEIVSVTLDKVVAQMLVRNELCTQPRSKARQIS
jgi:hypothetical protein